MNANIGEYKEKLYGFGTWKRENGCCRFLSRVPPVKSIVVKY